MKLKNIIRKFIYKEKSSSDEYVKFLKSKGVRIGDNTIIYEPMSTCIDNTRPWLIEIGNNVKITRGVTILTHGYDWSVINGKYGDILGSSGKVKIGNNVFIGMNTTILKGVEIGDDVIIGANCLVNKNIPSGVVVAGNPCKVISSLQDYRAKRQDLQLKEAKELAIEYKKVYSKNPPEEVFHEFFWLWKNPEVDKKLKNETYQKMLEINDNFDLTISAYNKRTAMFESFESFLDYCFKNND